MVISFMGNLVMIVLWVLAFIINNQANKLKEFGRIINLFKFYDFINYLFYYYYYLQKYKNLNLY